MRARGNQQGTLRPVSRATDSDNSATIVPGFSSGGMMERSTPQAAKISSDQF